MTYPAGPYPPNSELVGIAWLLGVTGLGDAALVGTDLPKDVTSWADEGFLQIQSLGARTTDVDLPRRLPVLQLDAWANVPSSDLPPWNLAHRKLELVRIGTEGAQAGRYMKPVSMPAGYSGAIVQAVYLISEPTRVLDDPSGYARVTADLAIDWVPA